jgi:hypothetical protein
MKRNTISGLMLVAFVLVPPVLAQNAPPNATTGTSTVAPTDATARQAARARDDDSTKDPRVCLEFPTNLQIIACAEKYRRHRRNG